jgi:hypothetical protein
VQQLYDGMVDYAEKRQPAIPGEADFLRSEQAAFAWRIARYGDAQQILDRLGDHFDRSAFENVGAMGELARSHAYAMRPALQNLIEDAERAAGMNDIAAALAAYRALLDIAKLPPDDKALFFLNSRVKQLEWQKQFEAGEWVAIQPGKDLAGWSPQDGTWAVDDQGGLVGTFTTPQLAWMPCSAPFIRGSYVIEGSIELPGDKTSCAGVGMTYNSLSQIYGLFLRRENGAQGVLRRDFWPGATDPLDVKPKNTFRFTFAAGSASAEVNEQKVFENYDVRYMWQANKSYLGVGGRYCPPGTKIRFTNLRIRAISSATTAPTTAPVPDVVPEQ